MLIEDYILYLEKTVEEQPDKVKKHLIKKFVDANIAQKEHSQQLSLSGMEPINLSDKKLVEQVTECINKSREAQLIYERWEFEKDYKYSVLFTTENFTRVIETISEIPMLNNELENEYIYNKFEQPVAYHTEERHFLKFNLNYAAIHPNTQEELFCKYPFLVVFHLNGQIIEFRFDTIKRLFVANKNESTIYVDLISTMKSFLREKYNCEVVPVDLDFMQKIHKNDDAVKLMAQFMKLPSGGNAQLSVGNNQEYILPFIGELRSLLAENAMELEKTPKLRENLEQFIIENEDGSDYPWIEVLWENDIVTRRIHVKFTFNYMNKDYCLIQHYYSSALIGMERMNHVVEYIVNNREGGSRTN